MYNLIAIRIYAILFPTLKNRHEGRLSPLLLNSAAPSIFSRDKSGNSKNALRSGPLNVPYWQSDPGIIERIRKKYIYNATFYKNPAIRNTLTENWWRIQNQLINAIYVIFLISAGFCMRCFVTMEVVGYWWFMCSYKNSYAFLSWKHATGLFMVVTTELLQIHHDQWW